MREKSFPIAVCGLVLLIGATAFYIFHSPDHEAPAVAGEITALSSNGSGNESKGTASGRPSERTVTRLGGPEHPSQTKHVDAENYSSNPPKPQYEREIVALAGRNDMDNLSKADQLLGRINSLPPEGKVLAMEYATKLIPDKHYAQFRPRIFQSGSSDELRETIMLDLLTRGDNIRMSAMLEFLRQPPTSTHEEIREFFVAYLDKDHGIDPQKWEPDVKQWLIENPEN